MGLLKATFNGINIKLRLNKDLQYIWKHIYFLVIDYISLQMNKSNACNLRHFIVIFVSPKNYYKIKIYFVPNTIFFKPFIIIFHSKLLIILVFLNRFNEQ